MSLMKREELSTSFHKYGNVCGSGTGAGVRRVFSANPRGRLAQYQNGLGIHHRIYERVYLGGLLAGFCNDALGFFQCLIKFRGCSHKEMTGSSSQGLYVFT